MRLILSLSLIAAAFSTSAATISGDVRDARGNAVADAVVYAVPQGHELPLAQSTATMDQKNRMFVPHVLPIQTGTSVRFPNSDDIRHQVYSFSPAKTFQLPLYKGNPSAPVVFDKEGVAMLGCNIHDHMSAYIVVVDTPYFATTGKGGRAKLSNVSAGKYLVRVWYPDMRSEPAAVPVTVSGSESTEVKFVTR
jgi:plastocyanin